MSKIRIKNFGPIKEGYHENHGWMDIKKVTVFIGSQGSGKSTVAKLISTLTWMEKALTRGDYAVKDFEKKDVLRQYLDYHKIENYFNYLPNSSNLEIRLNDISEIEYIGDSYTLKYKNRHLAISESPRSNYPLPQIMYVPADRNFITTVDDLKSQRLFSAPLRELLTELQKAKKEIKEDFRLPINDADLEYDAYSEALYVKGKDYRIDLTEASSGFQSLIPLYLVSWYLANSVSKQSANNREPMSSDELERFRKGVSEIYTNDKLTSEQKREAISVLSSKFNKTAFINIVEEPEQNLFPTSQWQILKSLLEFNNLNGGNKLIMTTHSPYIINYLSIAIQAGYLKDKLTTGDLMNKLNTIVPERSAVKSSDVVIYEMDEKTGAVIKLEDVEGIPSDKNYLNMSLAEGNQLFDSLLEIEQGL